MNSLFRPKSVAVVGASRRPGSVGGAVLRNLLAAGFQGPVYPVNHAADWVHSMRAWPSLKELPAPAELVVVAVPPSQVEAVLDEAIACGARAICVLTAGFGETSPEGRVVERRLAAKCRAAGIRMLGPNCLGVQNPDPAVRLDATFSTACAPYGSIAFFSQSGAIGLAALDEAAALGIGFSAFASLGNKADVSGNDLLLHFEDDPATRVILLYLESVGNPARFREIAARVARKKPIVAVKSGRSAAGARAAGSHTGALAGADSAVSALFRQSGVIRADTIEELFDVARVLDSQPLPRGPNVAVVTNAGGPGILATDALESRGLRLPKLDLHGIRAGASVLNPIDVLADATPEQYGAALRAALADPQIDAVVALYVPPITQGAEPIAHVIVEGAQSSGKTVIACILGTHGVPQALAALRAARVPGFRFPETAARALALAVQYAQWRVSPIAPARPAPPVALEVLAGARARLGAAGGWLDGAELARFAEAWGLPHVPEARVAAKDAAAAARQLGYPVVVKADGILHKTESGGVVLDLRDADAVAAAAVHVGTPLVIVQKQLDRRQEWLVGVVRDDKYGPLVTVGAGGTRAELWRDVEQRLAPLSDADVAALTHAPHIAKLLDGWRGEAPGDRAALEQVIRTFAAMAVSHPEIVEIEANPVLVQERGAYAVDLRARIAPA